ncbi:copper chaperone PCu(A)C [Thalassotalea mangrovi]|uniref:Copper chaperone PCu(A)C n=1 Tax=Thalassotalea mangrovi TaxID=2572245 RepID=A0A4U1B5X3_9GAMM|nr:copper chaperone PCu(A)C [Thalassotalea mangrovi]TKB45301.1 copper chaperone PCu(A)C [Thalassotalea mangrovi]
MKKIITLINLLLLAPSAFAANVDVDDAFMRELIPGTQVTSAYMTISNNSDKDITLVSVSGNVSKRIEIHEHTMKGGMMQMGKLDSIIIKANDEVILQPHGLHLMVFNPSSPVKAGEQVELTLHFDNDQQTKVIIPVKGLKPAHNH